MLVLKEMILAKMIESVEEIVELMELEETTTAMSLAKESTCHRPQLV